MGARIGPPHIVFLRVHTALLRPALWCAEPWLAESRFLDWLESRFLDSRLPLF